MPTWSQLDAVPRHLAQRLTKQDVPALPGVYAWYRDGTPIYVGKADSLVRRVWAQHLGGSKSVRSSAFRRNVAEHLGIASANAIYTGRYRLSEEELATVRAWVRGCELAWMTCDTEAAAAAAEVNLKAERLPQLTRR